MSKRVLTGDVVHRWFAETDLAFARTILDGCIVVVRKRKQAENGATPPPAPEPKPRARRITSQDGRTVVVPLPPVQE